MRIDRVEDIPNEAVPVLVDHEWQANSDDAQIVARIDGASSVEEIACEAGARLSSVRLLVFQLTWLGAVELHECTEIDDEQIVEVTEQPRPAFADALPLTRRRPANDSLLLSAMLATALGQLGD